MNRLICWLLGHQPRGPVVWTNINIPVLYSCDRCKRLIQFDRDKGWLLYHD